MDVPQLQTYVLRGTRMKDKVVVFLFESFSKQDFKGKNKLTIKYHKLGNRITIVLATIIRDYV